MIRTRKHLPFQAGFLALAAAAALASAWASPIVVQPGSPAVYKYMPNAASGSGSGGAPWTDVCVPTSGTVTPPAGTARVEAILVGGGGAGGPAASHAGFTNNVGYFFTGGGGGSGEVKVVSFPYSSGSIQITVGAGALPVSSHNTYMSSVPGYGGTTTLAYQSVSYSAVGGQSAFWSKAAAAPLSAAVRRIHAGGSGMSGGGSGLWVRYTTAKSGNDITIAGFSPARADDAAGMGYIPPPAITLSQDATRPGGTGQIDQFGALGGGGGGGYTGNGGNPRSLAISATAPFGLGGGAGGGAGADSVPGSSGFWFFTPFNWGTVYPSGLGVGQGFGGQPGRDAPVVTSSVLSGGIQMVAPCDSAIRAPAPAAGHSFVAWNNVADFKAGLESTYTASSGSYSWLVSWSSGVWSNIVTLNDPSTTILSDASLRASGYGAGGSGAAAFKVRMTPPTGYGVSERVDFFRFGNPGAGAPGVVLLRYHKTP